MGQIYLVLLSASQQVGIINRMPDRSTIKSLTDNASIMMICFETSLVFRDSSFTQNSTVKAAYRLLVISGENSVTRMSTDFPPCSHS
jgi:hypothetical protein